MKKKHLDLNCLVFKDTGIGISKHILPSIMERFVSYWEKGTGLGLAFCKDAMISMNGLIKAESQEGKYTKFTLCFPPYKTFQSVRSFRKWPKNVAIVDEDVVSLKNMKESLQRSLEFQNLMIYDDSLMARIKLNEIFHKDVPMEQVAVVIANITDGKNFFKAIQDSKIKRILISNNDMILADNPQVDVIIRNDVNLITNLCSELNWPRVSLLNKYTLR